MLYYTWTPNFTVFQMVPGVDSVWINVPEIVPNEAQEGFEEFMVISGLAGGVTDPVLMGFVADDIQAVANNDFLEANPAAARILANVQIPVGDVRDDPAVSGEDGDEDVDAMAAEWIEANRARSTPLARRGRTERATARTRARPANVGGPRAWLEPAGAAAAELTRRRNRDPRPETLLIRTR